MLSVQRRASPRFGAQRHVSLSRRSRREHREAVCRLALRGAVEEGEPRAAVSRLSLPAWCIGPIRSTCTDGRSNFRQLRGVCRRQRQLASGAATAWQRPNFRYPKPALEGPNCQTCAASTARRGATPPTPAAVTRPPRAGWIGRQLACSASARRFKPPLRFSAPGNLSQYCGPRAHDRCFELVLVREAAFPMRSAQSACGRVGRQTRGRAKRAP